MTMRAERVVLTTELPGRTAAYLIAEVRPQVNGIIQERTFVEGSTVQAGALLYQIDPAPYQAAFEQAKAALAVAEANLPPARSRAERLKGLVEIRAVGQQDYDEAAAALLRAEAGVASARAAVRERAHQPRLHAAQGADLGADRQVVGDAGRARHRLPADAARHDPAARPHLRRRHAVERRPAAPAPEPGERPAEARRAGREPGEARCSRTARPTRAKGKLQFRDVTVDPTTGSVVLRMVFPNPDAMLLPGMFVRAIVEEGVLEQAILAPQQGVTRDAKGNASAMVVDAAGKVAVRPIVVDRAIGDRWLVTSGLADGDQVIVEGLQRIRPGVPVKAVPVRPGGGARGTEPAAAAPAK